MAGQRGVAAANRLRQRSDKAGAVHHQAVFQSALITQWQWGLMGKSKNRKISLRQILITLTDKKIPFVLTGAHAIGGWTGQPRATADVDVLVKPGRNHARAVKALQELYPHLEVQTFHGIAAFFLPGEKRSVIDVSMPIRPDNVETLATAIWIRKHGLRYRIPTLEAALANKYGEMLSPRRELGKRFIDSADFTKMVTHSQQEGQQSIDLNLLSSLGEKVWPGGGGEEILRLVEKAKKGESWDVNSVLRGE
jgi:hypothetical protein